MKASTPASSDVGDIVIKRGSEDLLMRILTTMRTTDTYEVKDEEGFMYIEGDYLYYEVKCSKRILCSTCCREKLKLSEVDEVDVVQNDRVKYGFLRSIRLSPGLRITADPNTTVLVAMPDPATFAARLLEESTKAKERAAKEREEREARRRQWGRGGRAQAGLRGEIHEMKVKGKA